VNQISLLILNIKNYTAELNQQKTCMKEK